MFGFIPLTHRTTLHEFPNSTGVGAKKCGPEAMKSLLAAFMPHGMGLLQNLRPKGKIQ
jgi:hypothetical protein